MTAADDLRALSTAATPGPWVVMRTGIISDAEAFSDVDDGDECHFGSCTVIDDAVDHPEDAALIVALRNRAAAIVDLADAVKAVPRHRYPDEKTGTCFRCFLPWPCPTERAHRALDALEANRA